MKPACAPSTSAPVSEVTELHKSPEKVSVGPRSAPETCKTMAEVRVGVDALDLALVQLLAERQRYMDAAARIKSDRGVVRDSERIEDVVTKVLAAADTAGLSPAIAEPVWRTLIDRCIAYEFRAWDRSRS